MTAQPPAALPTPLPPDVDPLPEVLRVDCRCCGAADVAPFVRVASVDGIGIVYAGYMCAVCLAGWVSEWMDVADDAALAHR